MKGTTILRQSLILLLGLPLWLASCAEDEEPRSYMPALATNSASGLTRFAATLSGSVTAVSGSTAAYDVFFLFAQGSSLTDAREVSAVPDPSVEGRYSGLAEGLVPGGDYCYAICARSGGSVARGELITFSTLESTVPVPGETFTALLSENSVTLSSSELLDDGGLEITQRGFAYKVYEEGDSEPLTSDRTRTVPLDAETFMAQITGLQAHTTYVARAYAVNRTGTGYGSSVVFTTEDLKVPQLLCSASDSTSTSSSIQAEATLTSNGGFAVTAYGFCWSTESATPTVDNLRQEVGTGEIASFQALLANLEPATTYYLRAYAVNERGTGYSNTVTVQTTERQTVSLSQPPVLRVERVLGDALQHAHRPCRFRSDRQGHLLQPVLHSSHHWRRAPVRPPAGYRCARLPHRTGGGRHLLRHRLCPDARRGVLQRPRQLHSLAHLRAFAQPDGGCRDR